MTATSSTVFGRGNNSGLNEELGTAALGQKKTSRSESVAVHSLSYRANAESALDAVHDGFSKLSTYSTISVDSFVSHG